MLSRNTDMEHDCPFVSAHALSEIGRTYHSLSRLLQGLRPVTISNRQHPKDHMSELPSRPDFSFLMTSGAMYIGVPAKEFMTPAPSGPGALVLLMTLVRAIVLLPFAMTFAAPKSTNLIVELVPSRISGSQRRPSRLRGDLLSGLTSRCSIPLA